MTPTPEADVACRVSRHRYQGWGSPRITRAFRPVIGLPSRISSIYSTAPNPAPISQ